MRPKADREVRQTSKQENQFQAKVRQWVEAGVIDAKAAEGILAFEANRERHATLRWPVILAMAFGGILVAAGVTLFVAAHWNELSPAARFSLLLLMVGAFHGGGAAFAERFPALSTTLHGLGTTTLGAAIFLSGQIFNLHENWATGVLLWAIGAAVGLILLRDWVQAGLLGLLGPAWLISQWSITAEGHPGGMRPLAMGLIITAVCFLSARIGDQESTVRRTLVWIGGIALLPCVGIAIVMATKEFYSYRSNESQALPLSASALGWTVAIGGPLLLAWILRRRAAWMNILWGLWAYILIVAARYMNDFRGAQLQDSLGAKLAVYGLCAMGSVGLVAWGLTEKRKERVNLGIVGFALSVLFFYFDSFMGKLGRSASLVVLGVLCLAGGYVLEVTRRNLLAGMEKNS